MSRLLLGKLERLSEPTCGEALSAVPSSIVPSLRPNISVNRPLSVDASSGVNDSNVCAFIFAFARPTTQLDQRLPNQQGGL